MELVVRKTELLRELQLFQGIVERKNTIPILANVLIEANGAEMRMLATDLEVALRSRCDATVGKSITPASTNNARVNLRMTCLLHIRPGHTSGLMIGRRYHLGSAQES